MRWALLKIADSGVVLNLGKVVITGSAPDLIADPAVRCLFGVLMIQFINMASY
jgi:ABC-type branched-subunit amino acid transport system ATPase component